MVALCEVGQDGMIVGVVWSSGERGGNGVEKIRDPLSGAKENVRARYACVYTFASIMRSRCVDNDHFLDISLPCFAVIKERHGRFPLS